MRHLDVAAARLPLRDNAVVVSNAARVAGGVGDAVVTVDLAEHERRASAGLGEVTSLAALDALMCLPLHLPVPTADVGERCLGQLRAVPPGCVEWLEGGSVVRRLVVPPLAVSLVVVRARCWRTGLRRAAAFAPFATRVVLLDRLPAAWPAPVLDVVATGAGVWAPDADGSVAEFVSPTPFEPRWAKPARWRFAERAYGEWLKSTRP